MPHAFGHLLPFIRAEHFEITIRVRAESVFVQWRDEYQHILPPWRISHHPGEELADLPHFLPRAFQRGWIVVEVDRNARRVLHAAPKEINLHRPPDMPRSLGRSGIAAGNPNPP